jgi:hypothetical protein
MGVAGVVIFSIGLFFLAVALRSLSLVMLVYSGFPLLIGGGMLWGAWSATQYMAVHEGTSVSRAIEYLMNRDSRSSSVVAWHVFRFRSAQYADNFRNLNTARLWNPKKYAETKAEEERSNIIQLLILIGALGLLALWVYVNR